MDLITKTYDTTLEVNEGKREVLAIISTNTIDRDGEIVNPSGMKKKNYAGNPVVMVNHNYQTLPVGKALWVKQDGDKILAKYRVSDKTELARDVFALLQDGTLSAHSIGFSSLRASAPTTQEKNANPELAKAKKIHREWELMEFSVVGIPANPEALTLAVSKGLCKEAADFLTGGIIEGEAEDITEKPIIEKSGITEVEVVSAFYRALIARIKGK